MAGMKEPNGEGWWKASDGLWYSPETHPDYVAPVSPPSSAVPQPPATPPAAPSVFDPAAMPTSPPEAPVVPTSPPPPVAQESGNSDGKRRRWVFVAVAAVAVAGVIGAVASNGGDDESDGDTIATGSETETSTDAEPDKTEKTDKTDEPDGSGADGQASDADESDDTNDGVSEDSGDEPEPDAEDSGGESESEPESEPDSSGTGGEIDDPRPIGEENGFTWADGFSDDSRWEGYVVGIVEVPAYEFSETPGRCLIVLGVVTPIDTGDGIVSYEFAAPSAALLTDGAMIDNGYTGDCDVESIEAAGYDWILNASVTQGTSFPFYEEVFLEGDNAPDPDLIVIGNPQFGEAVFYEAPILAEAPPIAAVPGPPIADTYELFPVGPNSQFVIDEYFGDSEWSGEIDGIVEVDSDGFFDGAGRCFVVFGTLTPSKIAEGSISDPFSTPSINLILDGRVPSLEFGGCEESLFEEAGYDVKYNAEVTLGTEFRFYEEIFVAGEAVPDPEAIVVGSAFDTDFWLYEATIFDSIPE